MKSSEIDEAVRTLRRFCDLYEIVGENRHEKICYASAVVTSTWLQRSVGVNIPMDLVREFFVKELDEVREKLRALGLTEFEP